MTRFAFRLVFSLVVAFALLACATYAVTIETVPIGNPGNPADTRYDPNGVGAVPYAFRMGMTEVTNSQYVEFLNAVAASDPYGLYDSAMGTQTIGGIMRTGSPGKYSYAVKPPAPGLGAEGAAYTYGNKPAVPVSWYDAIRFVNWMHNGQGNGDTETGAYTLLGRTATPSNANNIVRDAESRWFLPSEDEWYKAAYHKNDDLTDSYWDYPTRTNEVPNNNPPSADSGNSANYGLHGSITDADAYALSASPYGTLNQGGNVAEWVEDGYGLGVQTYRVIRGADWINSPADFLHASHRRFLQPQAGGFVVGFRLATIIPEPGTVALAVFGLLVLLLRPRRLSTSCAGLL